MWLPMNPAPPVTRMVRASFMAFLLGSANSVCFHPELDDCFYNRSSSTWRKAYWGAEYAKPTMMLFNLCGPHHSRTAAPHLDAVTFRGMRYRELAGVAAERAWRKSGLFTDHLVKMAQVITWWYLGENGTFTYWPDGPLGEPAKVLDHPLWNKGVARAERVACSTAATRSADRRSATFPGSSTVRCSATTPRATTGRSRPTAT